MSEKMSEVYEAYDMEILGAVRGRGSMILKTDQESGRYLHLTAARSGWSRNGNLRKICMRQDFTILTVACRTGKES